VSQSNIFLGTCGWSYKEWEGNFYEKRCGQSKLRSYARIFKTVEIDSTFYRNPNKATVMGWLKYSPADFFFTAKLPKTITHDKALGLRRDVKADLEDFLDLMMPLLPPEMHLTADFAYFRWHGHGESIWFDYRYSEEELEPWVLKVQEAAGKVKKVYGYFNNHYHGYAPENCLQLLERLGLLSEEQKKAKAKNVVKQSQLGSFFSC